jgi:hypothetical protein
MRGDADLGGATARSGRVCAERDLSEMIMRWGRSVQDGVGIDGTTGRPITTGARIQRGAGTLQGGEGVPPTQVATRRRRGHSHDQPGAHEVIPT